MNLKRVALLCMVSFGCDADDYAAPFLSADWVINTESSVCELKQEIPFYGIAGFTQQSGELLRFSIREDRLNPDIIKASLTVEQPPWGYDFFLAKDYLVSLESTHEGQQYSRLSVYGVTAETMLLMLSNGLFPRFDYINASTHESLPETRVRVSAVNFNAKYQAFLDCRKNFLPHDFKDRLTHSLFFKPSSSDLIESILQQLNNTAKYISEVKGAKVVIVSDTFIAGKRDKKWFLKRAGVIVNQLKQLGVPEEKITVQAGGLSHQGNKVVRLAVFGPDALRIIYYRKGNISLNKIEMQRLDLIVNYMNDFFSNGYVFIKSYTDSKGSKASNLKVSENRANVIKNYLMSKGLEDKAIKIKAYGERKPVKSNRFPRGRAQNRRVTIDFFEF